MDRRVYVFMGLGFELIGIVLAFLYVGKWVDEKYQLGGLGTAGMVLFGMILWIVHLLFMAFRFQKDTENEPPPPSV